MKCALCKKTGAVLINDLCQTCKNIARLNLEIKAFEKEIEIRQRELREIKNKAQKR